MIKTIKLFVEALWNGPITKNNLRTFSVNILVIEISKSFGLVIFGTILNICIIFNLVCD